MMQNTKTQFVEKTASVIFIQHDAVKELVFSDVYEKYPIACYAFRADFVEGTEDSVAQIMIGFIREIKEDENGNVTATLSINSRYSEVFDALDTPTVQVISSYDRDADKTSITKFRLLTKQRIEEINRKRAEARNNRQHNNRRNFKKRQ